MLNAARAALCVATLASGTAVHAAELWNESPIKMVYPMADGSFALGFEGGLSACTSSGTIRYVHVAPSQNGVTADGAKNMLATVLMALATDRAVAVAYSNSSNFCYVNRLYIVQ